MRILSLRCDAMVEFSSRIDSGREGCLFVARGRCAARSDVRRVAVVESMVIVQGVMLIYIMFWVVDRAHLLELLSPLKPGPVSQSDDILTGCGSCLDMDICLSGSPCVECSRNIFTCDIQKGNLS